MTLTALDYKGSPAAFTPAPPKTRINPGGISGGGVTTKIKRMFQVDGATVGSPKRQNLDADTKVDLMWELRGSLLTVGPKPRKLEQLMVEILG